MAKGKQAALAANRRLEAAHDHIDRLTSELVDAKMRAKQAEQRAARLEGADKLVSTASAKHDEMLADALAALETWKRIANEDRGRRMEAMREAIWKLVDDLGAGSIGGMRLPLLDRWELIGRRYPAIHDALMAGQLDLKNGKPDLRHPGGLIPAQKKLSGDALRRFQRVSAMRATFEMDPDRDAADIWNDMLDAQQIGFSFDDMLDASPD